MTFSWRWARRESNAGTNPIKYSRIPGPAFQQGIRMPHLYGPSTTRRQSWRRSLFAALVAVMAVDDPARSLAGETSYHIDLARYFVTPSTEKSDRGQLIQALDTLGARVPEGRDPKALEAYLQNAEALRTQLLRHEVYLHLASSLNTSDAEARGGTDELDARLEQLNAQLTTTLQGVTPAQFAQLAKQRPTLAKYAYLVERAQRQAVHTLPAAQELILAQLSNSTLSALFDLYTQTLATTTFSTVSTPKGPLDARTDRVALAANPDREIRHQAAEQYWAGYVSRGPLYASILLDIVREHDRVARLRRFDDAPSAIYFRMFETRASVNASLASVARHADLFRDYQTLRARHVQKALSLPDVHSWDLTALVPGFAAPRFSIDAATTASLAALQPLGSEYVAEFRSLLEAANQRADIAPATPTRYNAGYSVEVPGIPSALYVGSFRGDLSSVRVIVHEGGHAVHGQFRNEHVSSPFYADGPNWLGEGVAILNELLLYDHLATTSQSPSARAYFLEALIDDMSFQIFTSAEEATLEQGVHDGVVAGRIRNASDLDALTRTTLTTYDIWEAGEPARQHLWMTKQLMFEDPLYLVNYLYAGLFATKTYAMLKSGDLEFRGRYLALLKDGYDAPPATLMRRLFGHDVSIDQLIDDDMEVFSAKVAELGALY
jgi:oligoendopeptidase F